MIKAIKNTLRPVKSRLKQLRDYQRLMKTVRGITKNIPSDHDTKGQTKRPVIMSGIGMEKIGLFAAMQAYIRWMAFADKKGYIPLVDMKYVPNMYLNPDEVGRVNAWEYYFKQTGGGMTLEEAYARKDKLIVNRLDLPPFSSAEDRALFKEVYSMSAGVTDKVNRDYWRKLWKKNISFNEETEKYINDWWTEHVKDGEKVLGVMLRGSDYVALKPRDHAVQPSFEQMKEKTDEFLASHKCDKIFFATEDKTYLENFIRTYGSKVIYIESPRIEVNEGELASDAFERLGVDKRRNGLQYAASISMLSKCDYLITSRTSATWFVFYMRETDFEYEYVFDLGYYE